MLLKSEEFQDENFYLFIYFNYSCDSPRNNCDAEIKDLPAFQIRNLLNFEWKDNMAYVNMALYNNFHHWRFF